MPDLILLRHGQSTWNELNLFTGRTRQEFSYTFQRWPATKFFQTIITMDDAPKKPHPDGLEIILDGRDPATALYLGDNIDDGSDEEGN